MPLGGDRIVAAALILLDQEGLDGLSTRRLASALHIQGPSLYHHFRNKAELLGQMAAALLSDSLAALDQTVAWDVWLRNLAHATRKMVLRRRDGARLLASSYPNNVMQHELVPRLAQPLVAAGFSPESANECVTFLATFVLGWTINEQNERMRQFMGTLVDVEEAFSHGVDTLVAGIASRTAQPLSKGRMRSKAPADKRMAGKKEIAR
jgi:TetR/AcrR family transcriptional regulator, tetracycline repressor protein